jgi:integrase
MASISSSPNGYRMVQFVGTDGKRRSIRLGPVSLKQAESLRVRIESLVTAKAGNTMPDAATATWVAGLPDQLHDRLARAGLVVPRAEQFVTLQSLTERFLAAASIKPSTRKNYESACLQLLNHFKPNRLVTTITPVDAEEFRAAMRRSAFAQATTSKVIKVTRQVFRRAVKLKIITESPFADISAGSQTNTARLRFVSREQIARVMDACPSNEWRLLIALSRFAGLRCPSEHLALRWEDVDWERGRLRVTASKTEAHANRESRLVPLFPDVLPYLRQAFEEAEPGSEYVMTQRYRRAQVNLGTQLRRMIQRAGIEPWPRVWHNLRASCQTELSARFPLHVVCHWLGNTTTVATQHYLTVRESDYEAALVPVATGDALQKAMQHQTQPSRIDSQTRTGQKPQEPALQALTNSCELVRLEKVPPEGLEPSTR